MTHLSETREDDGYDTTTPTASRRALIDVFCANADSFSRRLAPAEGSHRECVCHGLAISIELSLKAYLMHAGTSDDWNRLNVRHDLQKALGFAQSLGLGGISSDVSGLISVLSEPYRQHALKNFAIGEGAASLVEARRSVRRLLSTVRAGIDATTASEHHSYAAEASG